MRITDQLTTLLQVNEDLERLFPPEANSTITAKKYYRAYFDYDSTEKLGVKGDFTSV